MNTKVEEEYEEVLKEKKIFDIDADARVHNTVLTTINNINIVRNEVIKPNGMTSPEEDTKIESEANRGGYPRLHGKNDNETCHTYDNFEDEKDLDIDGGPSIQDDCDGSLKIESIEARNINKEN
ncbi:hypothetical protein M8J77_008562 [Diaphorina citri]|nr:hypothetical protein M8J77_008562 [Diaphorina citri]